MAKEYAEELVFLTANVRGIKFYPIGYDELMCSRGFLHVRLIQEPDNPYDPNSILVVALKSGETIGHLERTVAAPVSELLTLHGIVLKRFACINYI